MGQINNHWLSGCQDGFYQVFLLALQTQIGHIAKVIRPPGLLR